MLPPSRSARIKEMGKCLTQGPATTTLRAIRRRISKSHPVAPPSRNPPGTEAPKKRGRPPKTQSGGITKPAAPPEKRGRPPKLANAAVVSAAPAASEDNSAVTDRHDAVERCGTDCHRQDDRFPHPRGSTEPVLAPAPDHRDGRSDAAGRPVRSGPIAVRVRDRDPYSQRNRHSVCPSDGTPFGSAQSLRRFGPQPIQHPTLGLTAPPAAASVVRDATHQIYLLWRLEHTNQDQWVADQLKAHQELEPRRVMLLV